MLELIKNKGGSFILRIKNAEMMNETVSNEISKKIVPLLEEHDTITIDMSGILSIDSKGYNVLSDLFRLSVKNNCGLLFVNMHPDIYELINSLDYTLEG